jgi:hypothetical protein
MIKAQCPICQGEIWFDISWGEVTCPGCFSDLYITWEEGASIRPLADAPFKFALTTEAK